MPEVRVRFHGSLNDFLPLGRRDAVLTREFDRPPGIVDVIQALGVPHSEIDLILLDGLPATLAQRPFDGQQVDVFGPDRPFELARFAGLIPAPPEPRRFVLDGHLGRLARYLRMLGFDTRYDRQAEDAELARISAGEERILLTRDRGLLKRSIVRLGYLVRDDDPRRQLSEVVDRYELAARADPFSLCVRCNGEIRPVEKAAVAGRLAGEPRTLRYFDTFGRCGSCDAVYWPGSHYERMSLLVGDVLRGSAEMSENRPEGVAHGRSGR